MDRTDEYQSPSTSGLQTTPTTGEDGSGRQQEPPCAVGEHDVFNALVDAHRPELLRYARRQLGSRAELAEDLVQEAFLNAYGHFAAGARPQNSRAWLFAIVHNAVINSARGPQSTVSLEAHRCTVGAPTPLEAIEQREWLEWLMGAIGTLPPRQRDALVGHALEGRSYRELASRGQTTVSAIKTLIHRARRGLEERSPMHAFAAPFLLVSRRLTRFTAHRALAGKLSANGIGGMLATVFGTATLATGILTVHAGHSVAIAASRPQAVSVHAHGHRRSGAGRGGASQTKRSAAVQLHHEARRATVECEHSRHLDRRLRVAALQYAASHLGMVAMEYTDCAQTLQARAIQVAMARGHRHASTGHRGKRRAR